MMCPSSNGGKFVISLGPSQMVTQREPSRKRDPFFSRQLDDVNKFHTIFQEKYQREEEFKNRIREQFAKETDNAMKAREKEGRDFGHGHQSVTAVSTMYVHGKQSRFSSGFMNIMYRDNSLGSATRQLQKSPFRERQSVKKQMRDVELLEARQRKRRILKIFREEFGVHCKIFESEMIHLTEEQLYIKLRLKHFAKIELQAVLIIQKFTRMIINRLWWVQKRERRTKAAKMI
mmetsp:Transcript_37181/g.57083  ORF Transcript_37181/g.57083 Transcript_37181/m.57083 type:complete len:232 (+) Transcript_37181:381-1076(+)